MPERRRSFRLSVFRVWVATGLLLYGGCSRIAPSPDSGQIAIYSPPRKERPFSAFLEEILVAEGVRTYAALDRLEEARLDRVGALIVNSGTLTGAEIEVLEDYLDGGGRAIVFQPQAELAEVLGLGFANRDLQDGHWRLDGGFSPATSDLPLQFKGKASCWTLPPGAARLASLYTGKQETSCAGIARVPRGRGEALIFAFDPVSSVVLMRQGDPEKANLEGDGVDGIRPHEMVQDGFWDPDLMYVPQADLLQRTLVDLILESLPVPVPRVWYFPEGKKALLLMTGDAHEDPPQVIDRMLREVESFGGTASIYLLPPVDEKWSRQQVREWLDRGHDISVHPDHEGSADHTREQRWKTLQSGARNFEKAYGFPSPTIRNDWIIWYGWAEQARMQARLGVGMDLNFLSSVPTHFGYMFGSGMPMRFIGLDGVLIDHFQQPTHFEDDAVVVPDIPWSLQLTTVQATAETTRMLQDSLDGFYNVLCLNIHPDYYSHTRSGEWGRRTMEFARSRDIPIWSAGRWLDFIRGRNSIQFESLEWEEGRMSFTARLSQPVEQASLILPARWKDRAAGSIRINGRPTEPRRDWVGGREVLWMTLGREPARKIELSYR